MIFGVDYAPDASEAITIADQANAVFRELQLARAARAGAMTRPLDDARRIDVVAHCARLGAAWETLKELMRHRKGEGLGAPDTPAT